MMKGMIFAERYQLEDFIGQGGMSLVYRAVDIRSADLGTMAVVIGSEGQGVRREILEAADRQLIIPMNPHCESLNAAVAAAIAMWQMKAR